MTTAEIMNDFDFSVRQGWQCPICKRVYSPFVPVCSYCGAEGAVKTSTDWVEHQNEHYNLEPSSYTSISTGYAQFTTEEGGRQ